MKLDPRKDMLVVTNARGVQFGEHSKQFNNYRYEVRQARISIDAMLRERPSLLRHLEQLVKDPGNLWANHSFRRGLPKESPVLGGVRFERQNPRGHVFRLPVDTADGGKIVLDGAKGAQFGRWTTQRDNFAYRLREPQLNLATVLRDSPKLVQALAMAMRQPDGSASRAVFVSDVAKAFTEAGGVATELHQFREASKVFAAGDGVQKGRWNLRLDKVNIDVGRVVFTGWAEGRQFAGLAESGPAVAERGPAVAEPGPAVAEPPREFSREGPRLTQPIRSDLTSQAGQVTARAALDHLAPGQKHPLTELGESLTAAVASPSRFGPDLARLVRAPVSEGVTGFQILQPNRFRPETTPLSRIILGPAGRPNLTSAPAGARPQGQGQGDDDQAVAVVITGPTARLAAKLGTQVLGRDVLWRYARQHIWTKFFKGTAESAARAGQAARRLGAVLFFDPVARTGLWIDGDLATQLPVSSLLVVLDLSAGPPGRFRVFDHEDKASAHSVSSTTRL